MMSDPLRDAAPAEIMLANSPLFRVLAVVNFPAILTISEERGIVSFQDRIRRNYPNLQREQQMGIEFEISASGEMLTPRNVTNSVWRFVSMDGNWRVTLSSELVALEAMRGYVSRDDFVERFRVILAVFENEFAPSHATRIGVRYLNVIEAEDISIVQASVRQGLRSLSDTDIVGHIKGSNHSVTLDAPEGDLLARWGVLGPNSSHDAMFFTPAETRRWFLDLDCVSNEDVLFGDARIENQVRLMSERVYSFFRWAMTPEFIESRRNA